MIKEKLDLLERLLTKTRNVGKMIEEKYPKDENVHLMRTVPGIGPVTAAVVKSEIDDISGDKCKNSYCSLEIKMTGYN